MNKRIFTLRHYPFAVVLLSSLLMSSSLFADQNQNQNENEKASKADAAIATQVERIPPPVPVRLGKMYDNSFKSVDLNKDGKISFDENQEFKKQKKLARAKKETERLIKGCDKNQDGMITLNELPSEDQMQVQLSELSEIDPTETKDLSEILSSRCMFPKEILEIMDFNEDGVLSAEELLQGVSSERAPNKKIEKKMEKKRLSREAKRRKKEFAKCDTNSDEILTLREAFSMRCSLRLYTEQFDAYDTNNDGILTIDEVAKVVKPVEFEPPEDPEYIKRRKNMPPLARLQAAMYECDKDEDGRLSKSETVGARCEQDLVFFDKVDHNLDGYISNEEIERIRSKKEFDRMDKNKDGFLDAKEYKSQRIYRYE